MDFNEPHFRSISNLIFAVYTASKNQFRIKPKMEFAELHFFNLIFKISSADQQGIDNHLLNIVYYFHFDATNM